MGDAKKIPVRMGKASTVNPSDCTNFFRAFETGFTSHIEDRWQFRLRSIATLAPGNSAANWTCWSMDSGARFRCIVPGLGSSLSCPLYLLCSLCQVLGISCRSSIWVHNHFRQNGAPGTIAGKGAQGAFSKVQGRFRHTLARAGIDDPRQNPRLHC